MRRYQHLWEQVKLHKSISIHVVDTALYNRIIRGVRKEKCRDRVFTPDTLDSDPLILRSEIDTTNQTITFTLTSKYKITKEDL